ncbi:hypothetical protein [Shewanella sp. Isolate11]|uniref:hypothetical protein n=1 Tax=Shewanella sp. Isolate11 TaxID=2908530 RepID=UPI001EFCB22D|nr:hypothetical protein [Shewanella sp. Isolate11]MCG9697620.1 hypothetical protein [Shewanella sp. Isolate11]
MKLQNLAFAIGLISLNATAQDAPPIENISLINTESDTLSVQNFSGSSFTIDIYGKEFDIKPSSGLSFQCEGHTYLEILVKNMIHDYFEVPCNSRVIFEKNFNIQQ